MELNKTYTLTDVCSDKGKLLVKGGPVTLLHIFPASVLPDPDLVCKYWKTDTSTTSFGLNGKAWKQDRYIFQRPSGDILILRGMYRHHLSDETGTALAPAPDGGVPKSAPAPKVVPPAQRITYSTIEGVIEDIAVDQLWCLDLNVLEVTESVTMKIDEVVTKEDGIRVAIRLAYQLKDGTFTKDNTSSHNIPIHAFAVNVISRGGYRIG